MNTESQVSTAPDFTQPDCTVNTRLKPKSTFVPPVLNPAVATFCRLIEQEVNELTSKNQKKIHSNVSPKERQALVNLSNDSDIVIRKADKGGAVVIQSKSAHREEVLRQLSDTVYYTPLSCDPTPRFNEEVFSFLKRAFDDGFISQDEFNFLFQKYPVRPVLHTLPKIHKSIVEPVPGRPIVAGTQSLTEPISKYIDLHIKKSVFHLPSFVKDTTDFLNKIDSLKDVNDGVFVCTMDVTSLYTNVPHTEGLEALKHFLDRRESLTPPTDFLVKMTELILKRNYFKFEDSFYLQLQGVPMGSASSPNLSNLFMGKFEEDFVYNNNPFLPFLVCWFRYIDDIFFIFLGTSAQLEDFNVYINSRMPSIKFSLEFSQDGISFLDVNVVKNEHLNTSVYRKKRLTPTAFWTDI